MNGRFVLDTNIVIALIDGEPSVREHVGAADDVFIPSPVLGELYYGAFRSKQPEKNSSQIDSISDTYAVLLVDENTARIFGRLRTELKQIGKPIPVNDVWIAATAIQWSATIATRDEHYSIINGVSLEQW